MSQPDASTAEYELVRLAFRNSALRLAEAGRIEAIDAAIGAAYATHDLARHAGMEPHDAIEWMRSVANLMERNLLAAAARAH